MSIETRIQAINDHLIDDYSVLELAGADLTGVDKNIVNLKMSWKERLLYFMNNGTQEVWNNWNKVNGSGETVSLSNTEEAPMSLAYKGNTYQFTSNGTNLFNPAYVTTGATVSGNDITITTSGTSVVLGGSWASFSAPTIFTIPTGKKYLIPIINGEEVDAIRINLQGHYTGSEVMTSLSTDVSKVQGGYTLENPFEVTAIRVSTYGSTYSDLQGITFNFYVGPDNAYSPYGATPSPSLPSPVQVVSGDNSIEVSTNINNKGIRLGLYQIANGEYASPTSGNRYATFNDLLEVQPNTTYKVTTTNNINAQFYQLQYNESKTYLSNSSSAQSVKDYTFTTGATTKYLAIDIRAYDSTNITTDYVGGIEVIDTKASYPISLGVENLLNANVNKETISGVTFTPIYNDDSTLAYIVANGTATAGFNYYVYGTSSAYYSIPAGTYYLSDSAESGESNTTYFTYLDIENEPNLYLSTIATKTRTYSTSANIRVRIVVRSGAVLNNVKFYPMLEKGNTQSSYTPYGKAIELCKIGTYQDKINKSSGKNLFDGIFRQGSDNSTLNTQNIFSQDNLLLEAGTYTFSCDLPLTSFKYAIGTSSTSFPASATFIDGFHTTSSFTFTLSETKYVGIMVNKNNNTMTPSDVASYHFMLVKGTDTTFEPYGTGWYLKKEIGRKELDGVSYGKKATGTYTFNNLLGVVMESFLPYSGSRVIGMCNRSNHVGQYFSSNSIWLGVTTTNAYWIGVLDILGMTTADQFNTWLQSNETYFYYPLATPTYETITDTTLIGQLEALKKSYEGQTNISQTNNDLPFELDVVALSDGTVSTLSLGSPLLGSLSQPEETQEEPEVDSEESL